MGYFLFWSIFVIFAIGSTLFCLLFIYDVFYRPGIGTRYYGSKKRKTFEYGARVLFFFGRISYYLCQHRIEIVRVPLRFRNLPKGLEGKKFIQISDLHYLIGTFNIELIEAAVKLINQEDPDCVFITGDVLQFFDRFYSKKCAHLLSGIKCETKLCCLGGHDTGSPHHSTKKYIIEIFEKYGKMLVLDNQVILSEKIDGLRIVGCGSYIRGDCHTDKLKYRDESDQKRDSVFNKEKKFTIMLSHNPDSMRRIFIDSFLKKWNIKLMCSGHTHGGQLCVPFTKTPVLYIAFKIANFFGCAKKVRMIMRVVKDWKISQGLFDMSEKSENEENRYFYVNRGLGSHCNIRFFCRPEITVFRLEKI